MKETLRYFTEYLLMTTGVSYTNYGFSTQARPEKGGLCPYSMEIHDYVMAENDSAATGYFRIDTKTYSYLAADVRMENGVGLIGIFVPHSIGWDENLALRIATDIRDGCTALGVGIYVEVVNISLNRWRNYASEYSSDVFDTGLDFILFTVAVQTQVDTTCFDLPCAAPDISVCTK